MTRRKTDRSSGDLFGAPAAVAEETLAPGAVLLRGFALPFASGLLEELTRIIAVAPFRHMVTPGGSRMSVAMTSCGTHGWVTDAGGYRYEPADPQSRKAWPAMPGVFRSLATDAAERAGFAQFDPDACLINRYQPGARMSLHQDKDERDLGQPIVSVSLGLTAVFLFGGMHRSDPTRRLELMHGDVVVWGGPARLRYHGVLALREGDHPVLGRQRINLTFRRAT